MDIEIKSYDGMVYKLIYLSKIPRETENKRYFGICSHLSEYFLGRTGEEFVHFMSQGWEPRSNSTLYPIPSDDERDDQTFYEECDDLWAGNQGYLRRDLCKYILNRLDTEKNLCSNWTILSQ